MTQSSCKREVIPVWNLRRREFSHVNIPLVSRSTLRHHKLNHFATQSETYLLLRILITTTRGTQRPNFSKYAKSVSNGFLLALEACLVSLELPFKSILVRVRKC